MWFYNKIHCRYKPMHNNYHNWDQQQPQKGFLKPLRPWIFSLISWCLLTRETIFYYYYKTVNSLSLDFWGVLVNENICLLCYNNTQSFLTFSPGIGTQQNWLKESWWLLSLKEERKKKKRNKNCVSPCPRLTPHRESCVPSLLISSY